MYLSIWLDSLLIQVLSSCFCLVPYSLKQHKPLSLVFSPHSYVVTSEVFIFFSSCFSFYSTGLQLIFLSCKISTFWFSHSVQTFPFHLVKTCPMCSNLLMGQDFSWLFNFFFPLIGQLCTFPVSNYCPQMSLSLSFRNSQFCMLEARQNSASNKAHIAHICCFNLKNHSCFKTYFGTISVENLISVMREKLRFREWVSILQRNLVCLLEHFEWERRLISPVCSLSSSTKISVLMGQNICSSITLKMLSGHQ